jgi:hypothetical protein
VDFGKVKRWCAFFGTEIRYTPCHNPFVLIYFHEEVQPTSIRVPGLRKSENAFYGRQLLRQARWKGQTAHSSIGVIGNQVPLLQIYTTKDLLGIIARTVTTLKIRPWLISNFMHKILIYLRLIHLLKSSTCFEHYLAHLQEVYVIIVYMQPLVSSLSAGDCLVHRLRKNFLNRCTRQSPAESDDTRGCICTIMT